MIHLSVLLLVILAVELFIRMPILSPGHDLKIVLQKIHRVFKSKKISDHWKEQVLLIYAGKLSLSSIKIAGSMVIIALLLTAFSLFLDKVLPVETSSLELLSSWPGLIEASIFSIIYFYIRKFFVKR